MRVPRIFLPMDLHAESEFALPDANAHYLTRVLRMEVGRPLVVFNGRGGEYAAEIVQANKQSCRICLREFTAENRQSPLNTHLAIGISKGERFDWVLQKAVELGVTQITPLITERTEVRMNAERQEKKIAHWQQILVSSAEQCQRNILPELHAACELSDFVANNSADVKLVLHHRSTENLRGQATPKDVALLIGPEGGLSGEEIAVAQSNGFAALTLGPRVLRTETAPIAALSLVQFLWGDLS